MAGGCTNGMERLTTMSTYTHCGACREKLEHTALFCPDCGLCTCSWSCHTEHAATHPRAARTAAGHDTTAFASAVAMAQASDR